MKSLYVQRQERLREVLRDARLAAGLNQQDLCKRLKRNRNFVSTVELGTRMLEAVEFIEYAEALGLDPRKLITKIIE